MGSQDPLLMVIQDLPFMDSQDPTFIASPDPPSWVASLMIDDITSNTLDGFF